MQSESDQVCLFLPAKLAALIKLSVAAAALVFLVENQLLNRKKEPPTMTRKKPEAHEFGSAVVWEFHKFQLETHSNSPTSFLMSRGALSEQLCVRENHFQQNAVISRN